LGKLGYQVEYSAAKLFKEVRDRTPIALPSNPHIPSNPSRRNTFGVAVRTPLV
jgi:hypothetical protein